MLLLHRILKQGCQSGSWTCFWIGLPEEVIRTPVSLEQLQFTGGMNVSLRLLQEGRLITRKTVRTFNASAARGET